MMHIEAGLLPYQVLQRDAEGVAVARVALRMEAEYAAELRMAISHHGHLLAQDRSPEMTRRYDGAWEVALTLPAGGPYDVSFTAGDDTLTVPHVLVGDVWVLAGQSNMVGDGEVASALPPHPLVHAFYAWDEWRPAVEPVHFPAGAVDASHNATPITDRAEILRAHASAVKGAGLGLAFGRAMVRHTGMPQGLIPCAVGGTSMAQWRPRLKAQGGRSLYGAMLRRIRVQGQPVAGVLWYQGEAEADANPTGYTRQMQALVRAVREDLRQPDLPWIMAQLGKTHLFDDDESTQPFFLAVREQQRRLPERIRRLSVVPTIDLPMEDGIHLATEGQIILGERMARVACYLMGLPDTRDAIALQGLRLVPCPTNWGQCPAIEVSFANVSGELRAAGVPSGFRLIRPDGRVLKRIHKVLLRGDQLIVVPYTYPDFSMQGYRLAYGYDLDAYCNIQDVDGMSLPAFAPQPIRPLRRSVKADDARPKTSLTCPTV
jgi:sialate O-acetylesterase